MEYNLAYSGKFLDHFEEMNADEQRLISRKLDILKVNPEHRSLRTKPLRLKKNRDLNESSVSMDIRVIWQFDGDLILLNDVGHHDMVKGKKLRQSLKKPRH